MGACPVFDAFDPLLPEQVADPFPVLARARREQPVFFMPAYGLWCVTRYEDVRQVFADWNTYVNTYALHVEVPAEFAREWPKGHPIMHSLSGIDPPAHTRMRKLTQQAFVPKRVAAMEPKVRAIVERLLEPLAGEGSVDLVERFTSPLPVTVIASILGADPGDAASFKRWTDDWFRLRGDMDATAEERAPLWQSAVDFDRYLRRMVADRRAAPQDDLTSVLVHATSEDGDPALTDAEAAGVIAGLTVAGSDTTSVMIAEAIYLLLADRARWAEVARDRALLAAVIDETLRLLPAIRGLRRTAPQGGELAGVTIPPGAGLYVHIGSANRDEEQFERPDEFDPHRENLSKHVGFGQGIHFCVGAPLARLEARVALECLLDQFPDLRLRDGETLEYVPNIVAPTLKHLHVELGPPAR